MAAATQASSGIVGYFQLDSASPAEAPNAFSQPSALEVNADGTGGASAGDLYVADGLGNRVQQFSAGHEFIRLWGQGVVKSGPGNADEIQAVRVDATGGAFKLAFGTDTTPDLAASATAAQVEAALNGLDSIGADGVSVGGGPGNAGGTAPYLVSFDGDGLAGVDQPLLKATNGSAPLSGGGATVSVYTTLRGGNGFEICQPTEGDECARVAGEGGLAGSMVNPSDIAIDHPSGNLYMSHRMNRIEAYSATGRFIRAWGGDVVAAGPGDSAAPDEQQSVTIKATGGTFVLGFSPGFSSAPPTTGPIPYNASAATVQAALNALGTIGGSYGSVTVSGNGTGPDPYVITFHGTLGGDDLALMTATATALSGPEKSATVNAIADGGGYEVCNVYDACKQGLEDETPNALALFGFRTSVAVAPTGAPNAGNVLFGDRRGNRVLEFTPAGAFIRAFGWDVNATEPGTGFEVCVAASGDACKAGTPGTGIGQFDGERFGLAEDASGAIYAVEETLSTLEGAVGAQKFTPAGGLDLVPSRFGTNETQSTKVNAGAGQFRLSFGAEVEGTRGTGDVTKGSTVITNVKTTQGEFAVNQPIDVANPLDARFPVGQSIVGVGTNTLTLAKPAGYSKSGLGLVSDRPYTTPSLPYDASAGAVETALNALPSIAGVSGSVSVSGGPGDPGGTHPYLLSFDGGSLARTDPAQVVGGSGAAPLSGGVGSGANTVVTETVTPGGPNGTRIDSIPTDVAVGPTGRVFFAKRFPRAVEVCKDGTASLRESRIQEFDSNGSLIETSDPCTGIPGEDAETPRLTINPVTGRPYLLERGVSTLFVQRGFRVNVFGSPGPAPSVTLDPVSNVTPTSGTITGTIDPNGPGTTYPDVSGTPSSYTTTYRVEYKKASESEWTGYSPDIQIGRGLDPLAFSVGVGGLAPKTLYELKVVATKPFTATVEEIATFTTAPAAPKIESSSASNVTATSADLHALINPQGTETTYHFEYGTTPAYGQSTPERSIGEALDGQAVTDHIEGLDDAVYHFRVVATNALGTATSENQTFTFHPPVCPNQTVRQQTGAAYLPDCRAYELVSPEDAGGAVLFTGGPQSPYASSPPRLAFVGQFAAIPGAGRTPINNTGDLYLATRGASGWRTRYLGPSSEEAACAGGRPLVSGTGYVTTMQNDVMADPGLDRVINWNLGNPMECYSGSLGNFRTSDLNTAAMGSNAPYVWNANGDFLDRWPTSVGDVPGAKENFDCPQDPSIRPYPPVINGNIPVPYFCSTYVDASKDLSHFIFSAQSGLFGQGGLTKAPGSAYDNDTEDDTLNLVSELQNGEPIGQEPGAKAGPEELIQFPAISADGSRILMGTATKSACKQADYFAYQNDDEHPLCPIVTQPTHLYMRVNDAITHDVSAGKAVHYIGSTPDGTKVYFTSQEQLTGDDDDESTDLYMWSENAGAPQLIRVSAGEPDPSGNTDNCVSTWTTRCDVKTYVDSRISATPGNRGGLGSWDPSSPNPGYTDNAIAARSGDIYFYSPEQLVEGEGVPGKENLYVFREGSLGHVATLDDDLYCISYAGSGIKSVCSNGALGRLQVTPDGRYAAFVTTSRITAYDNQGHAEMYRYDAEEESVQCVSCRSDGTSPTGDVLGSQGGRFITDDGRVFFATPEALDPRDTNAAIGNEGQIEGIDVYEFVDGKAQLITAGTGTGGSLVSLSAGSIPGLYGVSADGVDVYFGTFDTLVGQDRNGAQLKFYNARTNGGFSFVPPPAPCAAADECRGPSAPTPAPPVNGTGAGLGSGGNVRSTPKRSKQKQRKQKKQQKQKKQRKHKQAQRGPSARHDGSRGNR